MQADDLKLDNQGLRNFGITTGIIFAILFGLVLPWIFDYQYRLWPWIVCAVLCFWGLLLPASLAPVYRGWMKLGNALGWINSRIILGFVFFTMFLVIGVIMRLFGKDPMARKIDVEATTYRVNCRPYNKKHVERPF